MSKKQPVCPTCGNEDCLAVEVKVEYDLNWRNDEYVIGKKTENDYYLPSTPDSDSICSCGACGWQGHFRELKAPKFRYEIKIYLDMPDDKPAELIMAQIRDNMKRGRPLWACAEDEVITAYSIEPTGEVK